MNGIWLLLLLGRWSMVTGWIELFTALSGKRNKKEFVSVDARIDIKQDPRSYEMLSRDSGKPENVLTPISATKSPTSPRGGRQTPDYFGHTARYQPHQRSFSSPRPPQQLHWDTMQSYEQPYPQSPPLAHPHEYENMNPLGMNRIEKDEEAQSPRSQSRSQSRSQFNTPRAPDFGRDQVFI